VNQGQGLGDDGPQPAAQAEQRLSVLEQQRADQGSQQHGQCSDDDEQGLPPLVGDGQSELKDPRQAGRCARAEERDQPQDPHPQQQQGDEVAEARPKRTGRAPVARCGALL
jgi:hypothetical protein